MPASDRPPLLIVDEDISLRLTLADALSDLGVRIEQASEGRQALEKLSGRNFSLILLDLRLPGVDGEQVLREFHRRRPDVPVVVTVEPMDAGQGAALVRAGAAEVLERPIDARRLRDLIAAQLDRPGLLRRRLDAFGNHLDLAARALQDRLLEATVVHAQEALALFPERAEPFNLLGIVAQLRMDLARAQRLYRTALSLNDRYEPAQRNLENVSGFPKKLSLFYL